MVAPTSHISSAQINDNLLRLGVEHNQDAHQIFTAVRNALAAGLARLGVEHNHDAHQIFTGVCNVLSPGTARFGVEHNQDAYQIFAAVRNALAAGLARKNDKPPLTQPAFAVKIVSNTGISGIKKLITGE
ncbi:MAG: hypothetical protein IJX69_06210 [Oscillospiraceae bacterium]|nr:hypothetical protein [Oscillospiraceae bacterium]